jgi:hypothetical protein
MTKNALKTAESTAVATTEVDDLLAEFAGAGTSSDAAHNVVPMVYVLQTNSPQVNKRGDAYVNGAEPGDLWLKNAVSPIVKGTEGVLFQPVSFQWAWVEWKPNRGGFVGTHLERPSDAAQKQLAPDDDRLQWVRANGNQVVETCYVYGLVDMELPYVIPLSSSGIKVAREWNTNARARKHNGKALPLFGTKYKLKTVFRSNERGEWFTLGFDFDEGLPTKEQIYNGFEFFKSIDSGEKRAEAPHAESESEIPF